MIHYITPYLFGDIGKAINDQIRHIPDDDWIVLRDYDTLFLLPEQGLMIEKLVEMDPQFDLIGCATNRLAATYQLYDEEFCEESDIKEHIKIANDSFQIHKLEVEEVPLDQHLAGMFYLFRKSLWNEINFEERSIQFDLIFCDKLRKAGKRLGIARGIYLFHLYRMGKDSPKKSIDHLVHCQDPKKFFMPKTKFGATNGQHAKN